MASVGRPATPLASATFGVLARTLPPPWNFAVGLAAFQAFFIPTGIMYWLASRTSPKDIDDVQHLLAERAESAHHTEVRAP